MENIPFVLIISSIVKILIIVHLLLIGVMLMIWGGTTGERMDAGSFGP